MTQTIVVAVDGSEMTRDIEQYVRAFLDPETVELVVVSVAKRPMAWFWDPDEDPAVIETDRKRTARSIGRSVEERLEQNGFTVTVETPWGDPGPEICRVVEQHDADEMVLGRRGHSGFREVLLGSVSQFVVHHASCPVLIVPPTNT